VSVRLHVANFQVWRNFINFDLTSILLKNYHILSVVLHVHHQIVTGLQFFFVNTGFVIKISSMNH
jgi:hypothetical protein